MSGLISKTPVSRDHDVENMLLLLLFFGLLCLSIYGIVKGWLGELGCTQCKRASTYLPEKQDHR